MSRYIKFSPDQDLALLQECILIDPFLGDSKSPYKDILESLIKKGCIPSNSSTSNRYIRERVKSLLDNFQKEQDKNKNKSGIVEHVSLQDTLLADLLSRRVESASAPAKKVKQEEAEAKALQEEAVNSIAMQHMVKKKK